MLNTDEFAARLERTLGGGFLTFENSRERDLAVSLARDVLTNMLSEARANLPHRMVQFEARINLRIPVTVDTEDARLALAQMVEGFEGQLLGPVGAESEIVHAFVVDNRE